MLYHIYSYIYELSLSDLANQASILALADAADSDAVDAVDTIGLTFIKRYHNGGGCSRTEDLLHGCLTTETLGFYDSGSKVDTFLEYESVYTLFISFNIFRVCTLSSSVLLVKTFLKSSKLVSSFIFFVGFYRV